MNYKNSVSILTKSDLVLSDIDLLKKFEDIDVNSKRGVNVFAMVGPYWPVFTDPEQLFKEFKKAGVKHVYSESLNTIGGNWTGVEKALKNHYPKILPVFKEIFFNKEKFFEFYNKAQKKIKKFSNIVFFLWRSIPTNIFSI